MKPGSLVECVDNSNMENVKLNTPYTVSKILNKNEIMGVFFGTVVIVNCNSIFLEEVTEYINIGPIVMERPFAMVKFRELLPPITNIEEHINKEVLKPELV